MTPLARHSSPHGDRIAVERLDLTAFRNYPSLRLALAEPARPVALSGPNGAGKTNLLEALSYLAPGRGLRGARLADVACRSGEAPWAVAGIVHAPEGTHRIGTGLAPALHDDSEDEDEGAESAGAPSARRVVMLDGQKLKGSSALAGAVSVLWLTPRMDRLFQDGPSERRRFFDQLTAGLFPGHAAELAAYEKLMRQRLKLLTENAAFDEAWLAALEGRMAAHAVALAACRREMLDLLVAHLPFTRKGAFPLPKLALAGSVEALLDDRAALEAEEAFAKTLARQRSADRAQARTTEGPHRTDLLARHPDKDLAAGLCSTGEQKAMLIGIVLAGARLQRALKGRAPLLLLDEIAAHLDKTRRNVLFDELVALSAQAWMTGTAKSLFAPLAGAAAHFTVAAGSVRPEPL
jgi:DNA replication and repair protein RecF